MMMKKEICSQYVWCVLLVPFFLLYGCNSEKVDYYNGKRALYFEREQFVSSVGYVRKDTVNLSLTHYAGVNEVRYPFKILLVGELLTEDTEYEVERVDSLSTAKEGMVGLPDKLLFKKGVSTDSLWVTIFKDKVPEDEEFCIAYQLVDNENFDAGYAGYTTVKVWFNNLVSKPLWWDEEVERVFLGEWSQEKFEALALVTGIFSFEGLSATEKRRYSLRLKEYVEENNLSMELPVY